MVTAFATLAAAPDQLLLYQSAIGSFAQILILILSVFNLLIFLRAILSWFMPVGRDPITRLLVDVTEPILAPARELMSRFLPMQGIDFSPLVVLLLIQFVLIPILAGLR